MAAPDFVASNLYTETTAALPMERRTLPRALFRNVMVLAEVSADFLACTGGTLMAAFLCNYAPISGHFDRTLQQALPVSLTVASLTVFLQLRDGAYHRDSGLLQVRETERALRIPVQALALVWLFSRLLGQTFSGFTFLLAFPLVPTLLILQKQFLFTIARNFLRRAHGVDRVVIWGAGDAGRSIASTLFQSPRLGFLPVAVVADEMSQAQGRILTMGYRHRRSVPVHAGPLTAGLLKSFRANLLLLTSQHLSSEEMLSATNAATQAGARVAYLSGTAVGQPLPTESFELDGLRFTTLERNPSLRIYAIAKRATDVAFATLILALLAPLFLLIAILIHFDSHGPVFFIQERVGKGGLPFRMFKFRSMHIAAPKYHSSPTTSNDPRITRIGRILRRINLDELPQLINVIRGEMSLVGPRPEMPYIVERYSLEQRRRLQVIPGITGLWQLSADRSFPIHHNLEYDFYYIRNRSFALDMAILVHTLFLALHGGI